MNKTLAVRIISAILLLLLMAVIFGFSAQNGSESSAESSSVTENLCRGLYPKFKEKTPAQQKKIVDTLHNPVRKTAHFLLYFTLGTCAFFTFVTYKSIPYGMRFLIPFLLCALYAASDEIHQYFVGGRGAMVSDVLLDSAAALAAVTLFWILVNNRRKRVNGG